MTQQTPRGIEVGAIAPHYLGITNLGKLYSLELQAGRPQVLILLGSLDDQARVATFIDAFQRRKADLTAMSAEIAFLTTDTPERAFDFTLRHPTDLPIATEASDFIAACGVMPPTVLVLDPARVVIGIFSQAQAAAAPDTVLACLASQPSEPGRDILMQAPVLLLRNVIGRAFCQELIELHDKGGYFDSGFMTIDSDNRPKLKIDHAVKKRQDHYIQTDHPMNARLLDLVIDRIGPEIKKAFHVEIAHCERFLIGRYEDSGHFRRHRDDSGAANAHRQFAITLNLNTEDYDGGYLTFPEYGLHRYRPGTGDALIFSGSMLHEASPVTRGKRYALLGFLHSAEAEARHAAYLEQVEQSVAAE